MDAWKLNLRHLWAVEVIEASGSLSAAAAKIHLSQPAVTQGVNKLEESLGTKLFIRQPGGMQPTEAGAALARRIRDALTLIGSTRVTGAQANAFLALARHGSYGAAARASGLKEPTLHRAVRDLEIALGIPLTARKGHGLAITKKGHDIARRLRLAQRELEAGLAELSAMLGEETGHIAIGAMPLCRARILPAALVSFMNAYPAIDISVVEGSHLELAEPLRNGELDLIIGALRDPVPGRDLCQTPLFEDRPAIFGRKGHPLEARSRAPQVAQLASYPWVVPEPGVPLRALWERIFLEQRRDLPAIPIASGSVMVIRQILLQSDCLTILSPDQVKVEVEAGWLTRICDAPGWLSRTIGITTRTDWRPTAAQQALIDAAHNAAADQ